MGSGFRARRGLRALVVTTTVMLTSAALVTAPAVTASADTATNTQRAQRGAQWLANQIKANGGFLETSGAADPVNTAYAVIGMRAAGIDKPASDKAVAFLKKNIGPALQLQGKDSPGGLADYIMASVADAQDPRHFGGTAAKNNLVNRLLATQRKSGTDKGLFGSQDPTFDGAFRQGLALAALAAVHVSPKDARVTAGITWLVRQQCTNGLWEAYRAKTTTACQPANAQTFSGPDTNSTAFALMGLAAWKKFPRLSVMLRGLKSVQSSDGGWPFVAAAGQPSDPDSTALVIQALVAERSSPTLARWKQGAAGPYAALGSYQLDCTSPDFGAFWFPGQPTTANVFATVQAVPAMAGKPFPVPLTKASTTVPLTPC
jgi:hypothetical protein